MHQHVDDPFYRQKMGDHICLRAVSLASMDTIHDNIRIYYLNKNENRRIVTIGKDNSVDVEATLII